MQSKISIVGLILAVITVFLLNWCDSTRFVLFLLLTIVFLTAFIYCIYESSFKNSPNKLRPGRMKKGIFIIGSLIFAIVFSIFAYAFSPKFGYSSYVDWQNGTQRLERMKKSPYYKLDDSGAGEFQNIRPLITSTSVSILERLKQLLKLVKEQKNAETIPTQKTDLITLDKEADVLVWFGHSSCFIQIEGKRIVVDPVFSEVSSQFPFFPKAFPGSNVYKTEDIPEIDYLIITHDHWDHLDYETVMDLKFKNVVCPLSVGAHLERFGIDPAIIIEMDWNENIKIGENYSIHCFPARHYSRRGIKRNQTLWASFLIETPTSFKIFIGGDGGYDSTFAEIGKKFGGIDLAILENGKFNEPLSWHMQSEETIKATEDLKAKALLPVHVAKFKLASSDYPWYFPLDKIFELSKNKNFKLLTPMIGQKIELKNANQKFKKWWKK